MKIGVWINYHNKLKYYLESVKECFSIWDSIVCNEVDYRQTPENIARNAGLKAMADCDLVWTIDSDELICQEDQRKVVAYMMENKKDAGFCKLIDYITPDMRVDPARDHEPIICVHPRVEFYDHRCARFEAPTHFPEITLHHIGMLLPEESIEWKKNYHWSMNHVKEYEKLLKGKSAKVDMPEEIQRYLKLLKQDSPIPEVKAKLRKKCLAQKS